MVDVPGLGNVGSQVQAGVGIIYWVFIGLVIVGAIVVVIMWFMLQRQYNKQVEIRKVVNNTSIIIQDRCKEFTDQEGHRWWLRWNEKNKILKYMPEPPASAINMTTKAKMKAVAKLIDGHYFWMVDTATIAAIPSELFKNIPADIANISDIDKKIRKERQWKEEQIENWKRANGIEVAFHPLTSNQRAIYINAVRRAEERKQKGWQTQLPMIVGVGAAVILVIALLIFYGNIAKPVLDMGDKVIKSQEIDLEQTKILQEIKQDIQVIRGSDSSKAAPGGTG